MSIFQAVNLYKRNIPFEDSDLSGCQYFTFGHFDALDLLPAADSLASMWEEFRDYDSRREGSYTSQPVFLTREQGWELDDDFHDMGRCFNGTAYPFLFLAQLNRMVEERDGERLADGLLHGVMGGCDDGVAEWTAWMNGICRGIRGSAGSAPGIKFACYYPLNISQGAVLMLSRNYAGAVRALSCLQMGWGAPEAEGAAADAAGAETRKKVHVFTISGVNYGLLNDETLPVWTEEEGGRVDVAFDIIIHDMAQYCGLADDLDEAFGAKKDAVYKATKSDIVGAADVRLVYEKAEPCRLLEAYRNIITPRNPHYRLGVSSFVSCWTCPSSPSPHRANPAAGRARGDDGTCSGPASPAAPLPRAASRPVRMLLRAADMLKKSQYIHYINPVLQPAVRVFRALMADPGGGDAGHADSLRDFLVYADSLLASTLHSDREFFEAPGFNMKLVEIPMKLAVAYNACLYELRSALVGERPENCVAFLVFPELMRAVKACMLFPTPKPDPWLVCVSLPMEDAFHPRRVLPRIAHECGHFAGVVESHMEELNETVSAVAARLLLRHACSHVYELPAIREAAVEAVRARLLEKMKTLFRLQPERMISNEYERTVTDAAEAVLLDVDLQNRLSGLFAGHVASTGEGALNEGHLTMEMWNALEEREAAFRKNRVDMVLAWSDAFTCRKIVDLIVTVARECVSDIIMVVTLRMSRDEYLLSLYDAGIRIESFRYGTVRERAGTVLRIMADRENWLTGLSRADDNERRFLSEASALLRANAGVLLDGDMRAKMEGFLTLCRGTVEGKACIGEKKPLLAERLYHQALADGRGTAIVETLQRLLCGVGGEA